MEAMTLEQLAYASETVAAVAVIVTLAYLAVQVRYARLASADVNRHYRAEGVTQMALACATNPGLAKLWTKTSQAESTYQAIGKDLDVSVDEAMQIDYVSVYWMWLHWGQYASINTPEDLTELEHLISEFYSVPPMSVSWRRSPLGRNMLDERFVRFVDEALDKKKERGRAG